MFCGVGGLFMSAEKSKEWVEKAEDDYRAATALDPADVPGVVCFLCQQCIEKYLKAALALHGVKVPKLHDLIALNEMVENVDARFSALIDGLQVLLPYSVASRYPGMTMSAEEARRAVATMIELRGQIRRFLGVEKS